MGNELKPDVCPFCGRTPEIINSSVHCNNPFCEAQPFTAGQTVAEAIAAWNRRALSAGSLFHSYHAIPARLLPPLGSPPVPLYASPLPQEPREAEQVCAEAYQVVGSLLSDLGKFDTDEAEKILDNLSQAKLVHKDVLPWPSYEPREAALTEPSGETLAQREEVCAAWAALPDDLRKDPRLTPLYRALGGPRMDMPSESERELRGAQEVKAGEDARDAARYRWLRDQNATLDPRSWVVISRDCTDEEGPENYWVGSDLDAAIDAATSTTESTDSRGEKG